MDFRKDIDDKEKQIKVLQQTLQGMQQQLLEVKRTEIDSQIKRKSAEKETITVEDSETESIETPVVAEAVEATAVPPPQPTTPVQALNDRDARLVSSCL